RRGRACRRPCGRPRGLGVASPARRGGGDRAPRAIATMSGAMRTWVGTSGFSYPAWKGGFYPEDLRATEMLAFYAERLTAVELNNTFYRMPSREAVAGWASRVPDGFRLVVKAPRRITHQA